MSEQYALGALLYFLLTGKHYLDFNIDRKIAYRQILKDNPLPFSRHGLAPWPRVEQALRRALSKEPTDRFPSVEEFARSLKIAAGTTPTPFIANTASSNHGNSKGESLIQTMLQRYGTSGGFISGGLPSAPTCSVNFGAAGLAYMFYRFACLRDEPHLLYIADIWSSRARKDSSTELMSAIPDEKTAPSRAPSSSQIFLTRTFWFMVLK